MSKPRVMIIFGTRPEAIKMAPVINELKSEEKLETIVTVTAQHREMLDQVLELFKIVPDYDLDVMRSSQSLTGITIRILKGLEKIISKVKPDLILVHGDTTSTFVGALASYYHQIRVGHVEAGLRTFNKYSPFPEELNRHLTGVLADLQFAPTKRAAENLLAENISADRIEITGNTVIDALLNTVNKNYQFTDPILKKIEFNEKKIILLTAHRRENLGQAMHNIFAAVNSLVDDFKEVEVVFPLHLNPKMREIAYKYLKNKDRVHLIEPLDYLPFVHVMARSYLILTDSGGIQEEAPSLGKPVLVLRDTTERPEAVEAGTVIKVGTDQKKIYNQAAQLLRETHKYNKMANIVNPYGDGLAASRIKDRILRDFGIETALSDR